MKSTVQYVVQSKWLNEEFSDAAPPMENENQAREYIQSERANYADETLMKFQLVKRTTTDEVLE